MTKEQKVEIAQGFLNQQTQNNIANAVVKLLEQKQPIVEQYLAGMRECFDKNGNVELQQLIGAMCGLPEHLEKMATAAKSYLAILREANGGN